MGSIAIENEAERFSIITNTAKPRYQSTKDVGDRSTGLGMISPVITDVAKMRLLNGIGFNGSDQREEVSCVLPLLLPPQ
jgi:hypothetical protein